MSLPNSPVPQPEGNVPVTRAEQVSPKSLVLYGVGTLILVGAVTWILAELATPAGVSVATADLSGLGRTIGLIAAAAVGVPAAVLAYHRQRALDTANRTAAKQQETAARQQETAENQHEHKVLVDNREHHTGVERNLRERYTTCAAQLGHDNSAIRVAGVYALGSLADDWHDFGNDSERQVCIDLLCAYLRSRPMPPAGDPEEESRHRNDETQVQAAVGALIRSRTHLGQWTDCKFDLSHADMRGADLHKAKLSHSNISHANLSSVDLHGADLLAANLSHAKLGHAYLLGANLTSANLHAADLHEAYLRHAEMRHAKMRGADLCDADLHNANLRDADLSRANLRGADLRDANLTGADLRGADLAGAILTRADLTGVRPGSGCRYSAETRWPEGFTPPPRLPDKPEQEF